MIWKELMKKIMNEENTWDKVTNANMVERPLIKAMKSEMTAGIFEVNFEI